MSTQPKVINLTSSSSSSSSSDDSHPLFRYPHQNEPRPSRSPFLPSSEEDCVVNPSDSSRGSDDSTERLEPIFNRLVREEANRASADVDKPQPSQPQPQLRPRARNPPLPTTREVVIALPAPSLGASYHGSRGKGKRAEVKGKGKGKME